MPGKGLRPFTCYLACVAFMACTSCMTFLPEFQGLESPYRGEHRVAAGAYGATNGSSLAGGALFHSVGMSDAWEWSTLGSLGLPSADYKPTESITYSLFTGPKWTNRNNTFGFGLPFGLLVLDEFHQRPSDYTIGEVYPGLLPTLYFRGPENYTGSSNFFIRGEIFSPIPVMSGGYRWTNDPQNFFINATVGGSLNESVVFSLGTGFFFGRK